MKSIPSLFAICLMLSVHSTTAQSKQVKQAPQNKWIEKVEFDKNAAPPSGQESSFYYLLLDEQENISLQESFVHYAYKILTNEGLQQMSDLNFEFDPSYEQLIVHAVSIHRDGAVINQLSPVIRTLQREQSMDRFLYDESLTAVINLKDVRVGDVIEYSFTRKGYNPIYDGYFSRKINFNFGFAYEKYTKRLIVPTSFELTFKYLNTAIQPEIKKEQNGTTYKWLVTRMNALTYDNHEPDWYYANQSVLISNFKDWGEVARWAAKRYEISERERQLVFKEFTQKFKGKTKEEYTLEAIRFVQDEVRYLGFESGLNSHKPHPPMQVYEQRFGDCKDKSLLLATILNANGIESFPVLLNTVFRSKLSEQLPSTNSFDHCIVQIKLNNHIFYVDPTASSQGGQWDRIHFPDYGKGLVVRSTESDLVDFPKPVGSSTTEVQTFDVSSIGGEGMMTMETTYTGADADNQRSYFANNNLESIQKNYLTYYGNVYPDIQKFETITTEDDRTNNIFRVKEKYKIPTFWKPYKEVEGKIFCEFYPQALEGYFNVNKSAQRTSPYRLSYPIDYTSKIYINLPEEWTVQPDHAAIESDYYKYSYDVDYKNKFISIVTHYTTLQESVPVSDFSNFVADHGKMMTNLSYSLSYDKNIAEKQSNKLPGIILTILSLGLGIWLVIRLYVRYNPKPHYPQAWALPIGGWLILVAIGLTVTPLRLIYDFITSDYLLSGEGWLSMWYAQNYTNFFFLFLEHIYNVVYSLFSVLLVILFYQRRSSVLLLVPIFYGVSFIVTILDTALVAEINPSSAIDEKELFRSFIAAAIWIPYFLKSQRVKKTFVFVNGENSNTMLEPQPV